MPGEIKFARLAESHGFAGIEKNAHWQFALLFVELQEQPVQPAIKVPIEVPEIVARDIIPVVRKFHRLPASPAAAFAFERAFRAALRK